MAEINGKPLDSSPTPPLQISQLQEEQHQTWNVPTRYLGYTYIPTYMTSLKRGRRKGGNKAKERLPRPGGELRCMKSVGVWVSRWYYSKKIQGRPVEY
jgi:hypothetical protein